MLLKAYALPLAGIFLPTVMATRIERIPRETSLSEPNVVAHPLMAAPPAPTEAPHPRFAVMDTLGRRDVGTDTCGFISGYTPAYPVACGDDSTCTQLGDYRGCCQEDQCTSSEYFYTECHDATETVCSGSAGVNTLCCTYATEYPYCVTYLWSTSTEPGAVYTQYNCDQAAFSGVMFLLADPPASSSPPTTTTSSSESETTTTSSSSTISSSRADVVPGGATETPDSDSSSNSGSSSSSGSSDGGSNTGAIVGGVVGGVAGIALIALAAFFLLKKRNAAKNAQPTGYQSPPGQQPPMAGYPPTVPGGSPAPAPYDPHYAAYAQQHAGSASPGSVPGNPYSPTQYSPQPYGNSPYPVPAGAPYQQQQQQQQPYGGQEFYKPAVGPTSPQELDPAGVYRSPPPANATEMPTVQPLGSNGNRAELS